MSQRRGSQTTPIRNAVNLAYMLYRCVAHKVLYFVCIDIKLKQKVHQLLGLWEARRYLTMVDQFEPYCRGFIAKFVKQHA